MKTCLLIIVLCVPVFLKAQSGIIDAVTTAGDITEMALEANDLIFMCTQTVEKQRALEEQVKQMDLILNNPSYQNLMTASEKGDWLEQTRIYSRRINMYGKTLQYALNALEKGMVKYSQTAAIKAQNKITSEVVGITEEVTEKLLAISGETSLSGTKRAVQQASTDKELGFKIREITRDIKSVMPMVLDVNEKLDDINSEVYSMNNALKGSMGMKVMFLMNLGVKGADLFAKNSAKESDQWKKWDSDNKAAYQKILNDVEIKTGDIKKESERINGPIGSNLSESSSNLDAINQSRLNGNNEEINSDLLNDKSWSVFVNKVWKWFYMLFALAWVMTFFVASFIVYTKTTGHSPEAFMMAAGNWIKGLIYTLVVFGVLSGLKALFVPGSLF